MNSPTAGRWAILAAVIALAYLIGAGTWATPTTAVGTVAHASSEQAEPIRVVVEVAPQPAAATPRADTTELAALLAAEDEYAAVSSTVVARAEERANRPAVTPAKATAPAKTARATDPAKAEQKAEKAAEKAQQKAAAKAEKAEKAEQKAAAKAAAKSSKAKSSKAKTPGAVKAPSNAELAWRIDQVAEDTCERHAGGVVAEDYTCVSPDFHRKRAS